MHINGFQWEHLAGRRLTAVQALCPNVMHLGQALIGLSGYLAIVMLVLVVAVNMAIEMAKDIVRNICAGKAKNCNQCV